jgi:hypothetical protein
MIMADRNDRRSNTGLRHSEKSCAKLRLNPMLNIIAITVMPERFETNLSKSKPCKGILLRAEMQFYFCALG